MEDYEVEGLKEIKRLKGKRKERKKRWKKRMRGKRKNAIREKKGNRFARKVETDEERN